ncbi:hypothetical protein [Paraburkholderia domus]|uniref:IS200/IS605 family transposase ISPa80 n=1 Tax=Paraburkholderia domus TaxID=2793075 RepID=A0A9N8QT21_9BURK|nr:hypothetical protein [Paraburkholderia domus]CAE6872652.1 IS200/IS605 family transposase ISPa80 [Paraburkholderia domus]
MAVVVAILCMTSDFAIRVLRLRINDRHAAALRQRAWAVNQGWNFCNELSFRHWERKRECMSAYDMQPYTKGGGKELGLHSQTVQAVQEEHCTRRRQHRKVKRRWRKSGGARRSLGWIPLKKSAIRYRSGQVWLSGFDRPLGLWDSYGLHQYELGMGCISEDSRGRWYLKVTIRVKRSPASLATQSVGIDLGLKEFFATSDGHKEEAQKFHRKLEPAIAAA